MHKKITYMVMGAAVGIILIGSVFAIDKSGAVNATDERSSQTPTMAASASAADKPEITNLPYVTDKKNEPATPIAEMPEEEDIEMLAKLIWGEARGVESITEKAAVAWCVLNRVDAKGYPNSIKAVITQPHQFVGYDEDYPVTKEHRLIAEDVLCRWYAEKAGEKDVGRVLPKEYVYFTGDGSRNHFTSEWRSEDTWNWSLASPYES